MATTRHSAAGLEYILPVDLPRETAPKKLKASEPSLMASEEAQLRSCARSEASSWKASADTGRLYAIEEKWNRADQSIRKAQKELKARQTDGGSATGEAEYFLQSMIPVLSALRESWDALVPARELPRVETLRLGSVPRAYSAAHAFLRAVHYKADRRTAAIFLTALQETAAFECAEIWMFGSFAQLVLLEHLGEIAEALGSDVALSREPKKSQGECGELSLQGLISCLQRIRDLKWNKVFEQVSVTHRILALDPQDAYSRMDFESRMSYCQTIAEMAKRSPRSEKEIAELALAMAQNRRGACTGRAAERRSHVGYYLIDRGRKSLKKAIGYRASWLSLIRESIQEWPDFVYLFAIELATIAAIGLFILGSGVELPSLIELTVILLPAIECAIAVTNLLATSMIRPQRLPRLDFSEGIPDENATIVVVPALVSSEEQVRQAVTDLEIRYLANRDPNLYFALLTDLPDSVQPFDDKDRLAELCSRLVEKLNAKYAGRGEGSFFHFHRHRVYNYAEGIWMGWERKRGKLLDFNNLLLNKSDNFPVKIGNLSVLPKIKYVITLDLDTQLPKGTARTLVGALAHPLNRAVVDPATNTVVEGYGILQPRVGISIMSANRTRLAAMFSMDTGFDIYTCAVSDIYQDLFGEASFAGKGIYELETFQQVLEQRFPCNTVLSHDLIEGAYARTGLVSDVEVIDDYPSHVSAYARRKHRWVRGDWQIILWLFPAIPDYFGKLVANPISLLSRWKIVDNLRRSLTEFATFVLLVAGWLVAPEHALRWTLAALAVIAFPSYLQFGLSLARSVRTAGTLAFWKNTALDFTTMNARLLLRMTLLCYQGLVMLDAVVRSLVRMAITHKRLLQWETAAQAEFTAHGRKDPLDSYLTWTPFISLGLGGLIALVHAASLPAALPILALWGSSKVLCHWLNRPLPSGKQNLSEKDQRLLRQMGLRTWRFFSEFAREEDNWLIPDVVKENQNKEKEELIAHRISPTNLGLLLNARLAAADLGFATLPEMVELTERTMDTVQRMPMWNGHLYNWYDTRTLAPLSPRFISTVDNGNLVCSLWTLKQGLSEARTAPLFPKSTWQGFWDHLDMLEESLAARVRAGSAGAAIRNLKQDIESCADSAGEAILSIHVLRTKCELLETSLSSLDISDDSKWWARQLSMRARKLDRMVSNFAPWLLPEFTMGGLWQEIQQAGPAERLTLESAPEVYANLKQTLRNRGSLRETSSGADSMLAALLSLLTAAEDHCRDLTRRLVHLGAEVSDLADGMDFSFLYDSEKKSLSIGYDAESRDLHESCYDLLASEARGAVFVAVAKGDIPPDAWLQLKRPYGTFQSGHVLISWTGTMFEYLMPILWMKPYPRTILEQSAHAAVHVQRKVTRGKRVPWGVSESSFNEMNPDGHYGYRAFGVQDLASDRLNPSDLVVSPYSTFLALMVDLKAAMVNLLALMEMGMLGRYGFYEACDFTSSRIGPNSKYEVVRCWMAHHQGMSLLAATNVLCDAPMQCRFHAEPAVAATERLLHEKCPRVVVAVDRGNDGLMVRKPADLPRIDWPRTPEFWASVDHSALQRNP